MRDEGEQVGVGGGEARRRGRGPLERRHERRGSPMGAGGEELVGFSVIPFSRIAKPAVNRIEVFTTGRSRAAEKPPKATNRYAPEPSGRKRRRMATWTLGIADPSDKSAGPCRTPRSPLVTQVT